MMIPMYLYPDKKDKPMIRFLLIVMISSGALQAQSKDGFSLEMFGAATSPITAFASDYAYRGVADWTELPFEAGFGIAYRRAAGPNQLWGVRTMISRMAFGYAGSTSIDLNGDALEVRPLSTRRLYLNFSPTYSFQLFSKGGFAFDLEGSISLKIPLNAYSLGRDNAGNNVDIDDLQAAGIGALSTYQAQLAPTFVWGATRLGIPLSYNMSSGAQWELLSGWSAGLSISYFIDEE